MCAIGGALLPLADEKMRYEVMRGLMWAADSRGTDASGVGFHKDSKPFVLKAPMRSSNLIYEKSFKELYGQIPAAFLIHARRTTKGSEKDNNNNHPVVSNRTGNILVHNGTVDDDDWRVQENGQNPYVYYDYQGQVDTECLLAMVDTMRYIPRQDDMDIDPDMVASIPQSQWEPRVSYMDAIDDASYNVEGTYACGLLPADEPNTIYLWRNETSPLFIAYVESYKGVVFASTKDILEKAIEEQASTKRFGFFSRIDTWVPEYTSRNLEEKTVVKISLNSRNNPVIETRTLEPAVRNRYGFNHRNGNTNLVPR